MISARLRSMAPRVAARVATPFYLVDIDAIVAAARHLGEVWRQHFAQAALAYPYKTNALRAITRRLASLGMGAEVASGAELALALEDGFAAGDISLGGPVKQAGELRLAVETGAVVKADSVDELERVTRVAQGLGRAPRCVLRLATLTDGRWSRFGLLPGEYPQALAVLAAGGFRPCGLHFHAGSNLPAPELHAELMRMYAPLIRDLARRSAEPVIVNIGGGFPARSLAAGFTPAGPEVGARLAAAAAAECGLEAEALVVVVEAGRALVEDFGLIVTAVTGVKRRGEVTLLTVDAGTNLARSMGRWYHPIEFAAGGGTTLYDVYGSLCYENDRLGTGVAGPVAVETGALVLIGEAGGYDLATANLWNRDGPPVIALIAEEAVEVRQTQLLRSLRAWQVEKPLAPV